MNSFPIKRIRLQGKGRGFKGNYILYPPLVDSQTALEGFLADHDALEFRVRDGWAKGVKQGDDLIPQGGLDVHQELTELSHTLVKR